MASSEVNKSVCSDQRDIDNARTVNTHSSDEKDLPNAVQPPVATTL